MKDSDTLRAALLRLAAGNATDAEREIVQRALQKDQITLATGDRAVALGGNATDAIIVTGNGNIVQIFQDVNEKTLRTIIYQLHGTLTAHLVRNASSWLNSLRAVQKDVPKSTANAHYSIDLDEQEQVYHLEIALKNALEQVFMQFHTYEKRDHLQNILILLSELEPTSEALRIEAMRLFTPFNPSDEAKLSTVYDQAIRSRARSQSMPPLVDAIPYLKSFIEALIAELYSDPFFYQKIIDTFPSKELYKTKRSLRDIVASIREFGSSIEIKYTAEQFEHDIELYITHLERTFRYLKLVGVIPKDRGTENKDPELNGIFVPLRVMVTSPAFKLETSLVQLLEHYSHSIVLLGGPGSGKSTATRHLAWSHALANLPSSRVPLVDIPLLSGKPIPLRIELRRLSEDRRQSPGHNFLSYITEVLLERDGIKINPQMFKELLERRFMLLLFDGLDEVATLDERVRIVEEIERFARSYPGNRVLVTSRPVGYEFARFSEQRFLHTQIQDFDDDQIKHFLERWYTYVLRLSPLPYEDQQELETLLKVLKDTPRLHVLAANPLLLTVITALHRYERLPDRRVLVYDRCADLLLDTWAKLKGTNARWRDMKLGKEDQYACIAHLGYVLHQRSQENEVSTVLANDVPTRFILREIQHFFERQQLFRSIHEQRTEATRFLELVQVEAGLIVERGTDEHNESLYGFVHRTFQEYFAAIDVHERYQQEADTTIISEFLIKHLHDPHWREVTLLLFGKLKRKLATVQMRQLLEGKSFRSKYSDVLQQDIFFICDCLIEDIPVENEFIDVIVLRMSDIVKDSPFPSQHQEALTSIISLTRTRQYSTSAQKALFSILIEGFVKDTKVILEVASKLLQCNSLQSSEKQVVSKILSEFVEPQVSSKIHSESDDTQKNDHSLPDLLLLSPPNKQLPQASSTTSSSNPFEEYLEKEKFFDKSDDAQKSDRYIPERLLLSPPMEEYLKLITSFNRTESQQIEKVSQTIPGQTDLELIKRHLLHNTAYAAMPSYTRIKPEEKSQASKALLDIVQRADVDLKYMLRLVQIISLSGSSEKNEQEVLSKALQRTDFPFEYAFWFAQLFYRSSPCYTNEQRRNAAQPLLALAQRIDISPKQVLEIAQYLYEYSPSKTYAYDPRPREWQQAIEISSSLTEHPDISLNQVINTVQYFYEHSPHFQYFYEYSPGSYEKSPSKKEWYLLTQMVSHLLHNQNLPMEKARQVTEYLSWISLGQLDKWEMVIQPFFDQEQRRDIGREQILQVAQYINKYGPVKFSHLESITHLLLAIAQHSNLPFMTTIGVAQSFYGEGVALGSWLKDLKHKKLRLAIQMFLYLARNQNLTRQERMMAAVELLKIPVVQYSERAEAVRVVVAFSHEDVIRQDLARHWRSISNETKASVFDSPFIAELARQKFLPTPARDELYLLLRELVPQFNMISSEP